MEFPLLSPKKDFVFQILFGEENSKDMLISLLSAILQIQIKSLTLLPREIPRRAKDLKTAVLDVTAELHDGTRIDIEMQVQFQPAYIDRVLFYWADFFTIQLKRTEKHRKLKKTISINIVGDCKYFFPHAHSIYVLTEKQGNPAHILTDKIEFHFIDLKRLREIIKDEDNELFILWMEFFTAETREEMELLAKQNKCIEEAYKKLDFISQDPKIRALAVATDKFLWDLEVAKQIEREEGREEGRVEIAKRMLAEGIPLEMVCKITSLSEKDLTD